MSLTSCKIFHSQQYVEKIMVPTCTEEEKISLECSCGKIKKEEIIENIHHSYDEGTVTKEATCEEEGIKIYLCTICDYSKGEKIDKKTHHSVYVSEIPPACTNSGVSSGYRCLWCDKKIQGLETLDTLNHDYEKGVCKNCGDITYSDGFIYELNVNTLTYSVITVGACKDENIIIPAYYNGLPVESIEEKAFWESNSLTIYCEANSQPETWTKDWNDTDCPVVWGYEG